MRRLFSLVAGAALAVAGLSVPAPAAAGTAGAAYRPVIFVHGSAGSASQFETQTQRLPATAIRSRSSRRTSTTRRTSRRSCRRSTRASTRGSPGCSPRTGADQVDLLGHSLGTFVMQSYLNSSPDRAARVAHYVNLDGRTAAAPPGGVPTLAIWGEGDPARAITGATNVYFPDQSHTQTVSSEESFREMFRFFRGRSPHTSRIVPDLRGAARISGRAVLFPSNAGVTDATLEVYRVSPLTGRRLSGRPAHRAPLTGDGAFGPIDARQHAPATSSRWSGPAPPRTTSTSSRSCATARSSGC